MRACRGTSAWPMRAQWPAGRAPKRYSISSRKGNNGFSPPQAPPEAPAGGEETLAVSSDFKAILRAAVLSNTHE
eukprot:553604-Prymnesium_polylepis.1